VFKPHKKHGFLKVSLVPLIDKLMSRGVISDVILVSFGDLGVTFSGFRDIESRLEISCFQGFPGGTQAEVIGPVGGNMLVQLGSTKQRMVLVVDNVGRATKILTKMFRVLHLVTTVTQAKNRVSVLRNAIKLILQRFPSATPAHRMPNSKMKISCSIDKTALASVGAPSKMSMIQCDCIVFSSD
jgi:hypothetical protein